MGLDVALVNGLRLEFPLDDYVRLGEPLFNNVAQPVLDVPRYVSLHAGVLAPAEPLHPEHGGQVVVEYGSILFERIMERQHRRQDLVVHFDQVQRLLGDVGAGSGDGRHRVALVQGLVVGHDVLRHEPRGALGFGEVDDLVFDDREVPGGRHRDHTWQRLGLAGVYRADAGVGVGAAQDLAVDHAGYLGIGAVLGRPRHLLQPVVTDGPGPNDPVLPGACFLSFACSSHVSVLTFGRMAEIVVSAVRRLPRPFMAIYAGSLQVSSVYGLVGAAPRMHITLLVAALPHPLTFRACHLVKHLSTISIIPLKSHRTRTSPSLACNCCENGPL